jgi:hypothetical protein
MADDQQNQKAEYSRLLKVRAALQEAVNTETAYWDGKGQKPLRSPKPRPSAMNSKSSLRKWRRR